MSNKVQNKKTASEFEREKKRAQEEIKPITFSDSARDLWSGILKSAGHDLIGGTGSSLSEQLLGSGAHTQLHEGEQTSLKPQKHAEAEKPEKAVVSEAFLEHKREVINAERTGDRRIEQQNVSAMEEIRMEIQKLMRTSKMVERTVKDAMADKAPIKPGKYHLTFFRWVLATLREATQKLEDTNAFGAVFQSKKQQSKYWNSYKKSGTSFGLSGERTVATQTG